MSQRDPIGAFRRHTEPDAAAMDRLRQTVLAPRRSRRWIPVTVALAAAAAAVLFLRPAPDISGDLTAGTPSTTALSTDVKADYRGDGHFTGTTAAPRVEWRSGRLTLEVAPEQGIDLTVQTEEALVEVVGTVFTVDRSPLGTIVSVTRGRVIVTCTDDDTPHLLIGEQSRTCLPADATGLLARANALRDTDAAPAKILQTVDRALLAPDRTPLLQTELAWLRLTLLTRLGRYDEAADEAATFIASRPPVHGSDAEAMLRELKAAGYGG